MVERAQAWRGWGPLVLAGAVGAAGLLVAWLAVHQPPLVVVGAGAVPLLLLAALAQSEVGVLALLVVAAAVRASLPTGTMSPVVASLILSAALVPMWLARQVLGRRSLRLRPAGANLPLLGFVGAAVFSYLWSQVSRDPLVDTWRSWPLVQLGSLAVMVLLPCTFLLTANAIPSERWLRALVGVLVAVGGLALIPAAREWLAVRPLFPLWLVSLGAGQALFNRRLPAALRWLLGGLVAAWLGLMLGEWTGWLSSWVPTLVGLLVVAARRHRGLVLLVVAVLGLVYAANQSHFQAIMAENRAASAETRMEAWAYNWQITRTHLLFGLGPAGYQAYYKTYLPQHSTATHNNYFDILSETGLVGLGFLLWFLAAAGLGAWRLAGRLRGRRDFAEGYAVGALAAWAGVIVAMALGDWVIPFAYTQGIGGYDYAVYNWIFLGGVVALSHLVGGGGEEGTGV